MKKFIPFLILVFLVVAGSISYKFGFIPGFGSKESIEDLAPSSRAEKFFISDSDNFPVFTKEVIADPFKVKEGEKQTFSIWAKDPQGIDQVRATIQTDAQEEIIELRLVEGDKTEGRWSGSWTTRDIFSQSSYPAVFLAINEEKKETKLTFFWQAER